MRSGGDFSSTPNQYGASLGLLGGGESWKLSDYFPEEISCGGGFRERQSELGGPGYEGSGGFGIGSSL